MVLSSLLVVESRSARSQLDMWQLRELCVQGTGSRAPMEVLRSPQTFADHLQGEASKTLAVAS